MEGYEAISLAVRLTGSMTVQIGSKLKLLADTTALN